MTLSNKVALILVCTFSQCLAENPATFAFETTVGITLYAKGPSSAFQGIYNVRVIWQVHQPSIGLSVPNIEEGLLSSLLLLLCAWGLRPCVD